MQDADNEVRQVSNRTQQYVLWIDQSLRSRHGTPEFTLTNHINYAGPANGPEGLIYEENNLRRSRQWTKEFDPSSSDKLLSCPATGPEV